jgi:hypothetical protein
MASELGKVLDDARRDADRTKGVFRGPRPKAPPLAGRIDGQGRVVFATPAVRRAAGGGVRDAGGAAGSRGWAVTSLERKARNRRKAARLAPVGPGGGPAMVPLKLENAIVCRKASDDGQSATTDGSSTAAEMTLGTSG